MANISEWNDFCNSTSSCGPNASHQVWAQSDLGFGTRWQPSWILERNNFSNSESLCSSTASSRVSAQSDLRFGPWWPSWILEPDDFSNSESPCSHNASHQVSDQSDLCVWRYQKCEKLTMDDRRHTTGHGISRPGAKLKIDKKVSLSPVNHLSLVDFYLSLWAGPSRVLVYVL